MAVKNIAMIMPETDSRPVSRKLAERLTSDVSRPVSRLPARRTRRAAVREPEHRHRDAGAEPRKSRSDWLLGQADQALYAAKYSGRNRVVSADRVLAAFAGAENLRDDPASETEAEPGTAFGPQAPGLKKPPRRDCPSTISPKHRGLRQGS